MSQSISTSYRERGLTQRLTAAISHSPIVVLRGARAVGKTSLCSHLVRLGDLSRVAELTDARLRTEVQADAFGWLTSQERPIAIDEAQLCPDLLVAAKRLVDVPGNRGSIVFTGSAEMPADSLGGLDPLAGRSTTLTLRPMTQREINGMRVDSSVLEDLFFTSELARKTFPSTSADGLLRILQRGGYPVRALSPGTPRAPDIAERVHRVIGNDALGRFDRAVAERVFRDVASLTSNIQNNSNIASALGNIKAETVGRYLSRLESVYLIEPLPALRGSARGATKAQPKIHVADSSLALWAAGSPVEPTRELLGSVLESFVVHEVRSDLSFSSEDYDYYYWRDSRGEHEVDLVVVDGLNRQVAIEVKLTSSIRSRDLAGIRSFREQSKNFHRGFVVYSGDELYPIERDIWAVPLAGLWDDRQRRVDTKMANRGPKPASDELPATPGQVAIFFSYAHSDDDTWGGAIKQLAVDLGRMFESETGETVRIFVDRNIQWGEVWRQRIDDEIDGATFLVPVVTPTYLRRAECRRELLDFRSKASAGGHLDFVLPIVWTMPRELLNDATGATDEVVVALQKAQYEDWTANRLLEGVARSAALVHLTTRLGEALERALVPKPDAEAVDHHSDQDDRPDLGTLLINVETFGERVPAEIDQLTTSLSIWIEIMGTVPPPSGGSSAKSAALWTRRVATAVSAQTETVSGALRTLEHSINEVSRAVDGLLGASRDSAAVREALAEFLREVAAADAGRVDFDELADMQAQLDMVGAFAKPMRPHILVIRQAIQLIADLPTLLDGWRRTALSVIGEHS